MYSPKLIDVTDPQLLESVEAQMTLMSSITDIKQWEAACTKLWGNYLATPLGNESVWWPAQPLDRPHRQMTQVYRFPNGQMAMIGRDLLEYSPEWFAEVGMDVKRLAVLLPPFHNYKSDGAIFFQRDASKIDEFLKNLDEACFTSVPTDEQKEALKLVATEFETPFPAGDNIRTFKIIEERLAEVADILPVVFCKIFSVQNNGGTSGKYRFFDDNGNHRSVKKINYGFRVRFKEEADLRSKIAWILQPDMANDKKPERLFANPNSHSNVNILPIRPLVSETRGDPNTNITRDFSCAAFEVTKGLYLTTAEAFGNDVSHPAAVAFKKSDPSQVSAKIVPLAISYRSNIALFAYAPGSKEPVLSIMEPQAYEQASILHFSDAGQVVRTGVLTSQPSMAGNNPVLQITGALGDNFLGAPVIQNNKLVGIVSHNVIEEYDHDRQPRPERLEGLAYVVPISHAFCALNIKIVNPKRSGRFFGRRAKLIGSAFIGAAICFSALYEELSPTKTADDLIANAFVATKQINVRKQPNGEILGTYDCGEALYAVNGIDDSRWTEIILPNRQHAYVASRYLSANQSLTQCKL